MIYNYDLLPIYNYFKAIEGDLKYLTTDNTEIEDNIATDLLLTINEKFSEITEDKTATKELTKRLQLLKMNHKYITCLCALERFSVTQNDDMLNVIQSNGFIIDKDNLAYSIQDVFDKLQSLKSLYNVNLEEYESKQVEPEKMDMYTIVSDVEAGLTQMNKLDIKINVQTTTIIQLAYYIKRVKEHGKRIKNTNRASS